MLSIFLQTLKSKPLLYINPDNLENFGASLSFPVDLKHWKLLPKQLKFKG